MTLEQFAQVKGEFFARGNEVLDWKAKEYSSEADVLQNFRQVAVFTNKKPSEVAMTYLLKHIQSISLAVQTGKYSWNWETEGGEGLKQRIADARNYLLLLAACLEEEAGNQ